MNSSKLNDFLNKRIIPFAQKIENQKHIQAIKDGMIAGIPIIIIGSFSLLALAFANLLGSGTIYDFLIKYMHVFTYAIQFTNDILSVYVAMFIARSLAQSYGIYSSQTIAIALVTHLILASLQIEGGISSEHLGATGLFTSILSGIMSVEVTRFLHEKNIVIKLPESVPNMVSESFASLIPLAVNVILAVVIANLSLSLAGKSFPELIMSILAPAISTMDTLPALLIVIFLTQLLWFFGLHGPSITSAVWAPFAIAYGAENIASYAETGSASHIFTFGLYYNILQVTGSGLTLGLVLMMLRSKSEYYKTIGKASIVPSIFGINEPVIFGAPILLNPFMFIPFVFGPLVITITTYLSMRSGLVGMPISNPPGFMPFGLGAYLLTLDWKAVVLVIVNLIIMGLFYYPFFKAMERNQLQQES